MSSEYFRRHWRTGLVLLFGLAVFIVCVGPLRPLLNYYEECHLFRWTTAYVREQASAPGGWMEWMVSFVTQFFYVGWLGALVVALVCLALQYACYWIFRLVRIGRRWAFPLSFLPAVLWFSFAFVPSRYRSEASFCQSVLFDYLARRGDWEALLRQAEADSLLSEHAQQSANYALAMRGRLADDLFVLNQQGPDGLLLDRRHTEALPLFVLSDIFFRLGLVNDAERLAFEAKQYFAANQRSGRLYRRLAEVNLVNGDSALAAKYLSVLTPTLFYRSWARKCSDVLSGRVTLDSGHYYKQLEQFRLKKVDQLSPALSLRLQALVEECPDNWLAGDYLEAYDLLRLDPERVLQDEQLIQQTGRRLAPKAVLECIVGDWIMKHPNDSFPVPISQEVFDQTMFFLQTAEQTRDMMHPSLCQPPYSQSYWHYYGQSLQRLQRR